MTENGSDRSFVSSTGFSAKGLAVSAFKFPVVHFLVKSGYSVVFPTQMLSGCVIQCRICGVLMLHSKGSSITPSSHCRAVGICGMRGRIPLISTCRENRVLPRTVHSRASVTILRSGRVQPCAASREPRLVLRRCDWMLQVSDLQHSKGTLEAAFSRYADYAIKGHLRREGLQLLALPHDKFWRHALVTHSLRDMVVCHPSSPRMI